MRHPVNCYYACQASILFSSSHNNSISERKIPILLYTDERVQVVEGSQHQQSACDIQDTLYNYLQQVHCNVWWWDGREVNWLDAKLGFAVRAPRCLPSSAGVALMSHVNKQPAARH